MWTNSDEVMAVSMTHNGLRAEGFIARWRRTAGPSGWTARFDIILPDGQRIRHSAQELEHPLQSTRYWRGHRQATNWILDTLKVMFPEAEYFTCV